jgi:putative transposase
VLRGYRYRFYPDPEQEQFLRRTIGCVRLVYNKSLAECTDLYRTTGKSPGCAEQDRHLTAWKKLPDLGFLNEVSSVPLQQALRHMHDARSRFFKKTAGYPSFKRKGHGGSATFTRSAFKFHNGRLVLAKMTTPLDIRWSRELPAGAKPASVTVSLDAANRWHVSLLCNDTETKKFEPVDAVVGIDLGIESLVTLSIGEKIANPRFDE